MSEPSSLHNQGIKIQDEADICPMIPAHSFREQQIGNAELHTGGVRLEPGGQVVSRIPTKLSEYLFYFFWIAPLHDGYLPKDIECGWLSWECQVTAKSDSVGHVERRRATGQGLHSRCPLPKSWCPESFVFLSILKYL